MMRTFGFVSVFVVLCVAYECLPLAWRGAAFGALAANYLVELYTKGKAK